jgi:hypothetical protein
MEIGGPYRRPPRMFTALHTEGLGTVYVSLGGPGGFEIDERRPAWETRYRARRTGQWSDSPR